MIEKTAKLLEARVGIEPTNKGFADPGPIKISTNHCNNTAPVDGALPCPCPVPVPVPTNTFIPIPLTRGYHAIVDLEDYERVAARKWSLAADNGGTHLYAEGHVPGSGQHGRKERLHRFILGAKPGEKVDHRNGDGLDNRRENLRLCTNAENQRNCKVYSCKRGSAYKGVDRPNGHAGFRARIRIDGKQHHLGYFPDELSAARCYDDNARRLFGDFARPNFSDGGAA